MNTPLVCDGAKPWTFRNQSFYKKNPFFFFNLLNVSTFSYLPTCVRTWNVSLVLCCSAGCLFVADPLQGSRHTSFDIVKKNLLYIQDSEGPLEILILEFPVVLPNRVFSRHGTAMGSEHFMYIPWLKPRYRAFFSFLFQYGRFKAQTLIVSISGFFFSVLFCFCFPRVT